MTGKGLMQRLNRTTGWPYLLVCALIGAVTFLLVFGTATLDVTNEEWIFPGVPEGDILAHYNGWLAFRNGEWAFPLGYTDMAGWPDGVLITLTDTVPLVSIVVKLFAPLLPRVFQFFGWYTLVCYALQGLFAGLLLRFFTSRAVLAWPGVALFTFSPILMERAFRHVSLTSHFLILAALVLYMKLRRGGYKKLPWQFVLVSALAMGIHPYFLPMVFAILAAALVEYCLKNRTLKSVGRAAAFLAVNAGVALLLGYVVGSVGWDSGGLAREGYGQFSMNLNALYNPTSLGDYTWSRLLRVWQQHPGQYDGFNYLGLGVLLALAFVGVHRLYRLVRAGRPLVRNAAAALGGFIKRHWVLLAVCAVLGVFAVSNVVTLNSRLLFTLPLPGFVLLLCNIFRASGRLFWPVYYLLLLFVLRYLYRWFSPRLAGLLACLVLAVQLADMGGVMAEKHSYFKNPPGYGTVMGDAYMNSIVQGYEAVIIVPDANNWALGADTLAMRHGLRTNRIIANFGGYNGAWAYGQAAYERLLDGQVDPAELYAVQGGEAIAAVKAALAGADVTFYDFTDEVCFVIPNKNP